MSAEKRIGFFWGSKEFSIVEARDNTPTLICRCPYESESSDVAALIQKALRDYRIDGKQASIAVPNSESMIRSFVLPAMNTSEMDRVIEFEIKKYIPFPIDQIIFVHHAFNFVDKGIKKMRIVLAAVRREILSQYSRTLEQAGVAVACVEPAVVSLIRALVVKKEVRVDQKVIAIILEQAQGQIVFIQKGVCQFVRDFSLMPSVAGQVPDDQLIKQKLFNEIHMSMDFYSRQFDEDKTDQLLVLSAYADGQLVVDLTKDFGVTVKHVTPVQILNSPSVNMQSIYAYGAALAFEPTLKSSFNFANKQSRSDHPLSSIIDWTLFDRVIKTAVACAIIFGLSWGASNLKIQQLKLAARELAQRQQNFADISAEELIAKTGKNNRKLKEYQKVRLSSELALILVKVPHVFGEGVWLRDLSVKYVPSKDGSDISMVFDVSGYVSLNDANKEIRVVNDLSQKIKDKSLLGKYFKNAVINSVERQVYQDRTVTVFTMTCS